jgi:hypothetical protein
VHEALGASGAPTQMLDGALKSPTLPPSDIAEMESGDSPNWSPSKSATYSKTPTIPPRNSSFQAKTKWQEPTGASRLPCRTAVPLRAAGRVVRHDYLRLAWAGCHWDKHDGNHARVAGLQNGRHATVVGFHKIAGIRPDTLIALTISAWFPVLESASVCTVAEAPNAVLGKDSPVGVNVATGPDSG